MALLSPLLRLVTLGAVVLTAVPACAQTSSARPQTTARLPSASAIAARTVPRADDIWDDEQPHRRAPAPAALFRTLCVRLCDGFFFPISFQTTRKGLEVDAARCQAKCGSGAQLFFHANPGGDVASARSFTGLQYESLPNAFRHLKARVPNCGCTPEPWSTSEQERHRAYAEAERAAKDARATAKQAATPPPEGEDARLSTALRHGPVDEAPREPGAEAPDAPGPITQPAPRRLDLRGDIARN